MFLYNSVVNCVGDVFMLVPKLISSVSASGISAHAAELAKSAHIKSPRLEAMYKFFLSKGLTARHMACTNEIGGKSLQFSNKFLENPMLKKVANFFHIMCKIVPDGTPGDADNIMRAAEIMGKTPEMIAQACYELNESLSNIMKKAHNKIKVDEIKLPIKELFTRHYNHGEIRKINGKTGRVIKIDKDSPFMKIEIVGKRKGKFPENFQEHLLKVEKQLDPNFKLTPEQSEIEDIGQANLAPAK